MRLYFDMPWGGKLEIERDPRPPMTQDKFSTICMLIAGLGVMLLLATIFMA